MEKRKLNLVKTVVGFDDAIEDKSHRYDCYINTHNRYWNGWANPYFEQKEWDRFIKIQVDFFDSLDEKQKEWEKEYHDEIVDIEPIEIDGKQLYYCGGFLCWNEFDEVLVPMEELEEFKELKWTNLLKKRWQYLQN